MLKLIALAASTHFVNAANTVRDCSAGKSVFKWVSASVTPDPIIPGKDSTISLACEIPAGVTVTGGTAEYGFTFNGIPFSPTIDDLCADVACPLTPGPYSNSTTSQFPSISGKVVSTIKWKDEAGTLLYCLETTVKV
jgi:hypothetical protein